MTRNKLRRRSLLHPLPPLPSSHWTVKCFSFSHFAFLFFFKFSYVHPPPKLACLMSNSKVCISLRAFLLVFPFSETSQSLRLSTFPPRQSDSLRGKFSTLLYLGSSRSELIGRTDAKIVLAPLLLPSFLSGCLREWLSEWFTSTEAWFYAAKWVVAVVFLCFVVFSWVGVEEEEETLV